MNEMFQFLLNLSESGLSMNKAVMELAKRANELGVWDEMEPQFQEVLARTEVFTKTLQEFESGMTNILSGEKPTKGEKIW